MYQDQWGNEITDNGDGAYTRLGVTVGQITLQAAINTFNALQPIADENGV